VNRRSSRRAFVSSLVALAAIPAIVFKAQSAYQQPVLPRRIGVLFANNSPESKEAQAFRQGLLDAGYAEGRDVVIEWRFASGDYAPVPALVADLVQRKVDVIVVDNTVAALAAKQATSTIPIVMALIANPIGSGLVTSLAHPGGNVTGLSLMAADLTAKRLQLLKETIPRLTRVAVLWNPDTPIHAKIVENLKAVAPSLSIELNFVAVRTIEEIDPAFSAMTRAHTEDLRRGRWADVLWGERTGSDTPNGWLCRQDPKGRQAWRLADRAADQIRAGGQSQDRTRARHYDPRVDHAASRLGDPVTSRYSTHDERRERPLF
jgi:ABC-type uncharacterized transport system substrate-binding protein